MGNMTKEQLEKEVERLLKANAELEKAKSEMQALIDKLNGSLAELKAELDVKSSSIRTLNDLSEKQGAEIERLTKIALTSTVPVSESTSSNKAADAPDLKEADIRFKMRNGLLRKQAIEVLRNQAAEDFLRASQEEAKD